jgi:hypothetical protein
MAEAPTMIEDMLLFAAENADKVRQVTPLTPEVKAVGSVLGVLVAGVGVWLALAHRAQSSKPAAERSLGAKLRWRIPIAMMLSLSGVLVGIGTWIDPTKSPGLFISVWLAAMGMLSFTLLWAGFDWWWVRRLATWERQEMIRDDRERLFDELSQRMGDRPSTNGQSR